MNAPVLHNFKNIRSAAVLTNSYVAGTVYGREGIAPMADAVNHTQLLIYVDFTIGSLTSAEVKVEFSEDGTNYYQQTNVSASSGTNTAYLANYTFTSTGMYRFAIPFNDRYVKVSVKGTGTVTSSSMKVDLVLATN